MLMLPDWLESEVSSVVRIAEGMKLFMGEDKSFYFGEWRAWKRACENKGKLLWPQEFKKRPLRK